MAKKQSASSRQGKQTRASAESIWRKPLNKRQKAALEAIAEQQANEDDTQIDYSDIPPFTEKQLAEFRRPAKRLIAVRVDADVLEWLRKFGPGYSTRINSVLRAVMMQDR